jgi:hypothetical protein
MFLIDNIITGEKLQQLADLYLGLQEDFYYNPFIWIQRDKHCDFNMIPMQFNNPPILFCYSHRLDYLRNLIHCFQNEFVLITHNSDENINTDNPIINTLLSNPKIKKWYAQNLSLRNNKIFPLPIGIANKQWSHGNLQNLTNIDAEKTENIFFNFVIRSEIRKICYDKLVSKVPFIDKLNQLDYYKKLGKYKFCVCPEGNGSDTHRVWESLYLRCVPIVVRTPFIELLKEHLNIPICILDSWDDLQIDKLVYENYEFKDDYYDIETYKRLILL